MAAIESMSAKPTPAKAPPSTPVGMKTALVAPATGRATGSVAQARPHVVVAIATFKRPDGLARVLDGVARLDLDPAWRVEALVVDNCPEASARAAVAGRAQSFPFQLIYRHESERGISHARNRALAEAQLRGADFLAFLDDDEEPDAAWLAAMVATAETTGCAAVVGPVDGRFEREPAAWMKRGGFFDIAGGEDGAPIHQNTAGNSMLRLSAVERLGLRFDPAFALSGGEDTMFFTALRRAGEATCYSAGARVIEDISARRASLGWLMTRWYRTGITPAAVERALGATGPAVRAKRVLAGAIRLVGGAVAAALTSPLALVGRAEPYAMLRVACRGAGMIAGAFDIAFEEYRKNRK